MSTSFSCPRLYIATGPPQLASPIPLLKGHPRSTYDDLGVLLSDNLVSGSVVTCRTGASLGPIARWLLRTGYSPDRKSTPTSSWVCTLGASGKPANGSCATAEELNANAPTGPRIAARTAALTLKDGRTISECTRTTPSNPQSRSHRPTILMALPGTCRIFMLSPAQQRGRLTAHPLAKIFTPSTLLRPTQRSDIAPPKTPHPLPTFHQLSLSMSCDFKMIATAHLICSVFIPQPPYHGRALSRPSFLYPPRSPRRSPT